MALETTSTSSLSNEAYDLITSFYDGVDEIVYEIAESLAKRRNDSSDAGESAVQIEVEDVREAGRLVAEALRTAIHSKDLDSRIVERIEAMSAGRSDNYSGDES